MLSHYRMRDQDKYEQEDYEEHEEYASEEEEEEEDEEEAPLSEEQQEFLKLREELKEKYRQKFNKEAVGAFGRNQLQDKKMITRSDNFGSFFGPSQPVIASRVLDERRSIQETQHIVSMISNGSTGNAKHTACTSSEKRTGVHKQQPKPVNEIKKKAQTLKDMRDYSFLLSDDTDFPDAKDDERPAKKVQALNSDGRLARAPAKSNPQMAKPARPVPNRYGLKNPAAKKAQSQIKVGPGNGDAPNKPKPFTAMPRKIDNSNYGSGRSIVQKSIHSKVAAQTTGIVKPPRKVSNDSYLRKKPSASEAHSSAQKNHNSDQKMPTPSLNKIKSMPNNPLPSSKSQPPKKIPPRENHEDRLKKKQLKRRLDDEEDAIGMIRKMFGYNPAKYSGADDDVSDMEADFREIQEEERRSAKIAAREDEEQLRLIEEEERRERMRKKQKLQRR